MERICKTCLHWKHRKSYGEFGYCDEIRGPDSADDSQAFVEDTDGVGEEALRTRPTFGCVLWSSKEAACFPVG